MSTPPPLTVFCPSCSTKFSVADHIIRGKFVKFRCKKCQGTIECDGRALSAPPPSMRTPSRVPGLPPGGEPARTSEPPMRLSISDGLETGAPSLAAPRVPSIPAPPNVAPPPTYAGPLFTGPPTAVDDPAKLTTGDTPVEGHTKSDFPRSGQDGTGKTWRRVGVAVLVAAAGIGGYILARQSVPPSTTTSLTSPAPPESKRSGTIDPGKALASDLAKPANEPTRPDDVAKTTEPTLSAAGKVIDPTARPIAKGPFPKPVARTESAPAPAEAPAADPAPTGQAAEAASAMAAVSNEHEFNKAAARSALEDAADRAASCRNIDTPAGAARVAVTFAPSGKVTSAVIESGPFVGTASGGCVASKFRNLHVPPFTSDEPVTVHKTLNF